jgi:hypothetical protein
MVFWVFEFQGDQCANLLIFYEMAKPVEKMLKQKPLHLPCKLVSWRAIENGEIEE